MPNLPEVLSGWLELAFFVMREVVLELWIPFNRLGILVFELVILLARYVHLFDQGKLDQL